MIEKKIEQDNMKISLDFPEWVVDYYLNYCTYVDDKGITQRKKNLDVPFSEYLDTYTLECVRNIIFTHFRLQKKILSKERRDKIHWLTMCNYNKEKYGEFIDYTANIKCIDWSNKCPLCNDANCIDPEHFKFNYSKNFEEYIKLKYGK